MNKKKNKINWFKEIHKGLQDKLITECVIVGRKTVQGILLETEGFQEKRRPDRGKIEEKSKAYNKRMKAY